MSVYPDHKQGLGLLLQSPTDWEDAGREEMKKKLEGEGGEQRGAKAAAH